MFQEERTARGKALGRDGLTHLKNRAAVTVAEVDGEGVERDMCLPLGMTGSEWRLWGGFLKKVAPGESEMRESQGQRLPWKPIQRGKNIQWDRQKSGGG